MRFTFELGRLSWRPFRPIIRKHFVLKRHAFRVVLLEPPLRVIDVAEHPDGLGVADLPALVDGYWSPFQLALAQR